MFDTNIDLKQAGATIAAAKLMAEARGQMVFLPAKYPDRGIKGVTTFTGLIAEITDYGDSCYVTVVGRDDAIETGMSRKVIEDAITAAQR